MYLTNGLFNDLQTALSADAVAFLPELILCGTIVLLLVLRLFRVLDRSHLGWTALAFTLLGLVVSWCQWSGAVGIRPDQWASPAERGHYEMFGGLLVYDNFTVFVRLFLFAFVALLIWLSLLTGIPDREDSGDFYCLLLGATLGMSLMASANHLLMVYIGVEMASLPSYGLAGFLKGRRQSSEAALKYVVYGGGASGVMLYGISLLAGKFGTAYLPDLAHALTIQAHAATMQVVGEGPRMDALLVLGSLFILIGLGFKLAAVPFHFWCPDVFEGAAAEVAAFLSVASKGAALALVGRLALTLSGLSVTRLALPAAEIADTWAGVARYLGPGLAFFAALTATFGNLAAYAQTNMKRLLAYSTIAHAGYMMMGLATLTREGAGAVLFYLIAYLFMNLGAFAVVAFIRNQTGSEDLSSYRGLVTRAPLLTVLLAVFLLSLLGMPPLAGFAAKLQIFSVLFDAGNKYTAAGEAALGTWMYALLVIGGINTALSAVYYIKVLKVMVLDRSVEDVEGLPPRTLRLPFGPAVYGLILGVMIFVVGLAFNPLLEWSNRGVSNFASAPVSPQVAERGPAR